MVEEEHDHSGSDEGYGDGNGEQYQKHVAPPYATLIIGGA
jgi:hypothetical protein